MDGSVQNILYPLDLFYGPRDFFISTVVFIKIKKKRKKKKGTIIRPFQCPRLLLWLGSQLLGR